MVKGIKKLAACLCSCLRAMRRQVITRRQAILIFSGLSLAGGMSFAAEFEVIDRFSADGYSEFRGTAAVPSGGFTVGGSTFVVKDGNVGIGTTRPGAMLDVYKASVSSSIFRTQGYSLASGDSIILNELIGGWESAFPNNIILRVHAYNDANGGLTVKNGGNVGIGTTGPEQKLTVAGTIESTSGGFKFPDGSTRTSAAILHVRDEKASGISGGASVAGTQIRTLNTVKTNTIPGASLASNQITLPAGTYIITATVQNYRADCHRIFFYNVSSGTYAIIGMSRYNAIADNMSVESTLMGVITIASTSVFDLREYRLTGSADTNSLGLAVNMGQIEVYADVFIEKIN